MATIATLILSILILIAVVISIFATRKSTDTYKIFKIIESQNQKLSDSISASTSRSIDMLTETIKINNQRETEILSKFDSQLDRLSRTVEEKLRLISENNQKQLSQMQETVNQQLNKNLTERLNQSFNIISERLELLYKNLGEIKNLSSGVSDLRKILGGVKTRGILGEVQLNSILEQMLAPSQYQCNVAIKPNSAERVEFAINLPGRDDQDILLPIDAKFPIEDYARFCDFCDKNMKVESETSLKQLENRIKQEAKKIAEKYIYPPLTTDFAIMYIPTEGMFAQLNKNIALIEELQNKHRIIICSPTTIMALLNSLQMGFKTLYIEKRSSEIWQALNVFKREFFNFAQLIDKTQKKISEASDTLEDATKKTNKIQKQLNKVTQNTPEYLSFDEEE